MGNLFSIFDPKVLWLNLSMNWRSTLILLVWSPSVYWISKPWIVFLWSKLLILLAREFKLNFYPVRTPGHTHWALSLFLIILLNNIGGITPYTFTASSHLTFSVSLALVSWLGYIAFRLVIDCGGILAHLVPVGTPYALIPFIVLIELVRNIIRPLTLSVRLAANLVAGHLLITLISTPASIVSWGILVFLISGLVTLIILERAVAFIQAYVFRILRTLYLREVNATKFNYLCN